METPLRIVSWIVVTGSIAALTLFLGFPGALSGLQEMDPEQAVGTAVDRKSDDAAAQVNTLADRYYRFALGREPERAYFSGVKLERHDGLFDNSAAARARAELVENELLGELEAIDPDRLAGRPEWITYAYLLQELQNARGVRVCRHDLWNVNQLYGWHTMYGLVAEYQPVGTPGYRDQALRRWGKFGAFIDQERANLERGLESGFSAPAAAVRRVIEQLNGLLAMEPADLPYASPARRDDDEEFTREFLSLVSEIIRPALVRYRDYLTEDYLPRARESLSILANPDGRACYEASLRAYTTLDRSGSEVMVLGQKTVAANRARVEKLGEAAYGLTDFEAVIEAVKNDPRDRFESREALLQFARNTVARAEAEMPAWVGRMPEADVVVEPYPEYQEGTGVSARYEPGDGDRPGVYRIPLHEPENQPKGGTETTAFHETWPGHHLQVALAQEIEGLHPVTRIIWFSGPGEGWARYSEALADEMGLYTTVTGPISRLAWPARGMVVDPGIHLEGWTREQAIEFMAASGRFTDEELDELVDRIAVWPGQLTAYDSGGLEIMALREQARSALGEAFDIREFHDRVLENGTIPLQALRAHIESWIEHERSAVAETRETATKTKEDLTR